MKDFTKLKSNQQLFIFYAKKIIFNGVCDKGGNKDRYIIKDLPPDFLNYVVVESLTKTGLRLIPSHIKEYTTQLLNVLGDDVIDYKNKQYIECIW